MSHIKIEVPAADPKAQRIFGMALLEYAEVNEARVIQAVEAMQQSRTIGEDVSELIGDEEPSRIVLNEPTSSDVNVEQVVKRVEARQEIVPPVPSVEVSQETFEKIANGEVTNISIGAQMTGLPTEAIETVSQLEASDNNQQPLNGTFVTEELGQVTVEDGEIVPPVPTPTIPLVESSEQLTPSNIWDDRIHASSKAVNQDGSYKYRRKPVEMTDEDWTAFKLEVESELSGLTPSKTSFEQLMRIIAPHMTNPDFIPKVTEFLASYGVANLAELRKQPQFIDKLLEDMGIPTNV